MTNRYVVHEIRPGVFVIWDAVISAPFSDFEHKSKTVAEFMCKTQNLKHEQLKRQVTRRKDTVT